MQVPQRIESGHWNVYEVADTAHIHQNLVGALVSERAAKLCNHSLGNLPAIMAARWRSVNAGGADLLVGQIDRINDADYGGINRGVGASDGGHSGKAFGGEQDFLPNSGAYGVEGEYGIAAV